MLACDGLHVRYGRVQVLHGVSLRVERDELVAIVGPNGAGKTTLLRTIVGLLPPTAGRVTFEGRSLVGRDPALIVADGRALAALHRAGTMMLLVEQNVGVALDVASRAYVLEHGSIVAEGAAASLRTDDRVMAAYLG